LTDYIWHCAADFSINLDRSPGWQDRPGVVDDPDIRRAANLMVTRHGPDGAHAAERGVEGIK
jgi:hypothetical protein